MKTSFTETVTIRRKTVFPIIYYHARFESNECMFIICANGNAVPIIDQHMGITIYMPLVVETKGNLGEGDVKVI